VVFHLFEGEEIVTEKDALDVTDPAVCFVDPAVHHEERDLLAHPPAMLEMGLFVLSRVFKLDRVVALFSQGTIVSSRRVQ
jgi:hypothetical protein